MAEGGDLVQLTPWSAPAQRVPDPSGRPTPGGKVTLIVGAVRDARAVGIQVGDLIVHVTPEEARAVGDACYLSAKAIELLVAEDQGRLSLG